MAQQIALFSDNGDDAVLHRAPSVTSSTAFYAGFGSISLAIRSRQLLLNSETPEHFKHRKARPREEQRYDAPIENGIHRVGTFETTASTDFRGRGRSLRSSLQESALTAPHVE
jgi:hypothetical protein